MNLPAVAFYFCFDHFLSLQKMGLLLPGITHFAVGLRSLGSRSSSLRSLSTPVGDAIFILNRYHSQFRQKASDHFGK